MLILKRVTNFGFVFYVSVLLSSCMSGLEPLPTEIGDLEQSVSIPVAKSEVGLEKTYHVGTQNWFLNQNVPEWAKYEYIFYDDTVTVDLYKIYEKSDVITYMSFSINIWNEFPVKGTLNMSFIDNTGALLYAFEPVPVIDGDILFNGNVARPGYSNSKVKFDKTLIENIRTANRLTYRLTMKLKDANSNSLRYFDKFKMNCQIGARVDFILKDI